MKSRRALPPLDYAQRYSIDEAIAYLRSSRSTVYEDIAEGRLATIKEGRRRFVPGSEIARRSRFPGQID
jgi:excisionase family DNA binding protein